MNNSNLWLSVIAIACCASGCSVLTDSSLSTSLTRSAQEDEEASISQIANPPARTIRFDGHEIILGDAEPNQIDSEKFLAMLQPLVDEHRYRSARFLIQHHRETSERLLVERWATSANNLSVRLVANELSRRTGRPDSNWNSLLKLAKERAAAAQAYQDFRNSFAKELQSSDPSDERANELQQLAQNVGHPLIKIDCLRLLGLRELVAGRTGWAESLCRQSVEIATRSGNSLLAAEMWLMVAEAARRSDQLPEAAQAWSSGVTLHLSSIKEELPIDVSFWLLAEHTRPEDKTWPSEIAQLLSQHLDPVGCNAESGAEMTLWASVAQAQYARGELQAALINFKKAETLVTGNNVMWLRIAQSKCLSGLGQVPAASAILSGPATSADTTIAAAATAAMGSTKLQSGAYQQGAQLLHKAISQAKSASWPTKNQALADLALAQLIIGDTDPGLDALHAVQAQFAQDGDDLLLIRSLENELRLLEHEHRDDEAADVKLRIAELESV